VKKGGVGKTQTVNTAVDLFDLHGQTATAGEIDNQDRLQSETDRPVTTISTENLCAARRDPGRAASLRPLMESLESARRDGATLMLSFGATQVASFTAFASLAELDDDLQEFDVPGPRFCRRQLLKAPLEFATFLLSRNLSRTTPALGRTRASNSTPQGAPRNSAPLTN